jgi:bifunctional non-homologous end joining protein LigD
MDAKTAEKITLYCNEGGSDKQYTAWLEAQGSGWTVQFQYGPRGGWVKGDTKTKKPVPFDEAKEIYEKLLKEKRAKGYREGEDAPAFSQTPDAVDGGVRPMLLTPDDEANLDKYVRDPAWGAQPKLNGKRIIARIRAGKVDGINRRGLLCPIPKALETALSALKNDHTLDGELVGDIYHVFDVIESTSLKDPMNIPCETRHAGMQFVLSDVKSPYVQIVPFAVGERAKREMVGKLREGRKEGVVFKRIGDNSPYLPGKVENLKKSIAVKIKFYTEGSFYVVDWKSGVSSVQVAALDGKKLVPVGNVTVAAKYADQVKAGRVIRIRYLYATPADQLYQPCLDPTDDGSVVADGPADKLGSLKHEGKDE